MTLYDVCNDYSLDSKVSDKGRADAETDAYKWVNRMVAGIPLKIRIHKEYDEIHYAKSDRADLDGLIIGFD